MADATDYANGCVPGCTEAGAMRLFPYIGADAQLVPATGVTENMFNHRTYETALELSIASAPGVSDDGCGRPRGIGRVWVDWNGGNFTYQTNGNIGGSNGGFSTFHFEFDCPTDVVGRSFSFQGGAETLTVITPVDEYYIGAGSNWQPPLPTGNASREEIPAGEVYRDNQGPGTLVWRQKTLLDFRINTQGSLALELQMFTHLAPNGVLPVQCTAAALVEDCVAGQSPRWRMGCVRTVAAPAFWTDFAAGAPWEYSSDSGATWAPAPASAPHLLGDVNEQHRWRQSFTVPPGYVGFLAVQHREGTFHGTMYMDGLPMADNQKTGAPMVLVGPGWSSGYWEVTAGPHTFEWREGEPAADGTTAPLLNGLLAGVHREQNTVTVLECLDAAGTPAATSLFDAGDGAPVTLQAHQELNNGLCAGCGD